MAKIEIVYDGKGNVLVADHTGATEFFFCDYDVPEKLTTLLSDVLGIACAASGTRSVGLSRMRKGKGEV